MKYPQILPIWQILFLFLLMTFGIHKLFLFIFVQKLAPPIYSYSYLREKLIFADHCEPLQYMIRCHSDITMVTSVGNDTIHVPNNWNQNYPLSISLYIWHSNNWLVVPPSDICNLSLCICYYTSGNQTYYYLSFQYKKIYHKCCLCHYAMHVILNICLVSHHEKHCRDW